MNREEIVAALTEKFGDAVQEVEAKGLHEPTVAVPADRLLEVCEFCRDDRNLRFNLLSMISGVDRKDRLQAVYHLDSTVHKHWVVLHVDCDSDAPVVPSVHALWPAANWHERETYDLMGIVFEGHPSLRRILCSEDWEGHPLRKDYQMPDEFRGIPNDFKQAGKK